MEFIKPRGMDEREMGRPPDAAAIDRTRATSEPTPSSPVPGADGVMKSPRLMLHSLGGAIKGAVSPRPSARDKARSASGSGGEPPKKGYNRAGTESARTLQSRVMGAAASAMHLQATILSNRESVYEPGDEDEPVEVNAVNVRVKEGGGSGTTGTSTRPPEPEPVATPRAGKVLTKGMVRPKNYVRVGKSQGVPVPCTGADITAEWLTLAFRTRGLLEPAGVIEQIDAKPIGEGQGEYGDLMAVEIQTSRGGAPNLPKFLICKMAPAKAPLPPIVVKGIYTNEVDNRPSTY